MPKFVSRGDAASDSRTAKLALVGGGNMARAILMGALDAGVAEAWEVAVADPSAPQRRVLADLGIRCVERAPELAALIDESTQLMLAVKPQMLGEVAPDIAPLLRTSRVVISILAGTPSARIREALGQNARIVRVMPNTPVRVRRGMAGVALGAGAVEDDDRLAMKLFAAVGDVIPIDESMLDAFTAVVGSGPAYVCYLAEAMCDAAVAMGFDAATADRIVRKTMQGSGALMAELQDHSPAELRQSVTSKGGTTAAAIGVLDEAKVRDTFVRALAAARDRGAELAKG